MNKYPMSPVILLILALSLSGCRAGPASGESPLAHTSPLATPTAVSAPTPIPRPPSDKGAITGQFVDYLSGEPAVNMLVYLGELSPFNVDGIESHTITVLPDSSPSTALDQDGYFAFLDVKPGTYAMVLWTPANSWVVSDPETKLDILVTVNAGVITDLGKIAIDLPD